MSRQKKRDFDPLRPLKRLNRSIRKRLLRRRFGEEWNDGGALQTRKYNTYREYLEHQKAKLATHDFADYDVRFRNALSERLAAMDIDWQNLTVLCLGARIGTEVKAFLDLGCRATGIDLNPGKDNPHVVEGDFHNLQFPLHSMDVVYTNSLDHAFDIARVATEVLKVLKPRGLMIIEAGPGRDQGGHPGFFESFFWNSLDELMRPFELAGFKITLRRPITYPWPGEMICLRPQ